MPQANKNGPATVNGRQPKMRFMMVATDGDTVQTYEILPQAPPQAMKKFYTRWNRKHTEEFLMHNGWLFMEMISDGRNMGTVKRAVTEFVKEVVDANRT